MTTTTTLTKTTTKHTTMTITAARKAKRVANTTNQSQASHQVARNLEANSHSARPALTAALAGTKPPTVPSETKETHSTTQTPIRRQTNRVKTLLTGTNTMTTTTITTAKAKAEEKVDFGQGKVKATAKADLHGSLADLGQLHVSPKHLAKVARKVARDQNVEHIPVNAMDNPTTPMMITGMKTKMASITTYLSQLRQILT